MDKETHSAIKRAVGRYPKRKWGSEKEDENRMLA